MTDPVAAAADLLGDRARRDEPLGVRTTYRVGGPAALLLEVGDEPDLRRASAVVAATGVPVLLLGRGSNLLVADAGFRGLVVVLGERWTDVAVDGDRIRAGGAASLPVLARRTAAAGRTGLEWAVGVPGSLGGGVRMNAGGHGADIAASLVSARVVDLRSGQDEEVAAADLDLGYRRSAVGPASVVVEAEFRLAGGDPARSAAAIADVVRWRREHQPGGQNAGSVFANPPGDSAGRLVEAAGARGLRRGSAAVSDKHANFIQADPGGSADDVAALVAEVRRRVEVATGVRLRTELRMVGFPSTCGGG